MAKAKTTSLLFFCLAFGAIPIFAQDTLTVSLSSAITRSLEISPEVRAKEAKVDFSTARYNLARASRFLPDFTATSAHSTAPALDNPNNTAAEQLYLDPDVRNDWSDLSMFNRVEFSAIQPLWTWGEIDKSIEAASAGIRVDEAVALGTEHQVAERAAQLYYALKLTEALSRLTTEAGDIVEKAKTEIDRLLEEGDLGVDYADLFQVQITEQEFLQRVVEAEESRKIARAALSRLLFLDEDQTVTVESVLLEPLPFEPKPLTYYQNVALSFRPELKQASAGLEARSALVEVAKSNWYPKFVVGVNGKWSYAAGRERQPNPYHSDPFLSRSIQIGFAFRQNLNFGQTRAKIDQAKAEASEVAFQSDAARQLILFEVEEAYRNVLIAYAAVNSKEAQLQISKEWLRVEQVDFDLEIGDTENLVKAVRDNLSIRATRHDAVYKYNVAIIKLLSKSGILLASIEDGTLVGL